MTDIAKLLDAAAFAATKHADQRRKNASVSPYINHPLAVASLLAGPGQVTDGDVLCAALLHDTIEDTETTAPELAARFGETVAAIVQEVTDDKSLPKAERKIAQVRHAPQLSRQARLVKLADKICNVTDVLHDPPATWSRERREAYLEWAASVVAGLRGINPVLEQKFDAIVAAARPEPGSGVA